MSLILVQRNKNRSKYKTTLFIFIEYSLRCRRKNHGLKMHSKRSLQKKIIKVWIFPHFFMRRCVMEYFLQSTTDYTQKPVVSIGKVGYSRVLAWRPFQWFLYMSRVSPKKFELNRTMSRIQLPDTRFWSIYLLKMAKMA